MRSFVPPRSGAADRKSAAGPRRAVAGPRQAQAPRQRSGEPGPRREPTAPPRSPAAGGLPEGLRTVMEAMSGFSLADVVVHRNSAEPARLGAHAFTKGNQIHVAPGRDRHLAHEAWHVVQQKQGRVRPTRQTQGVAINDHPHLEHEAEEMGRKAAFGNSSAATAAGNSSGQAPRAEPIQRMSLTSDRAPVQLYAAVGDIDNSKFLPTGNLTDNEKVTIANWCLGRGTNNVKGSYAGDYQHAFQATAETENGNIVYAFAFDWTLAVHIDFGGPAHGTAGTPHIQVVNALNDGSRTTTVVALTIGAANAENLDDALYFNSSDNAVALSMVQAQQAMNDGNPSSAKDLIKPKVRAFAEAWADGYADDKSGASDYRAARAQEEVLGNTNMFDEPG